MRRILIAYDGSEGAEAALLDLSRAALPARTEAKVLSIADVWLPPDLAAEVLASPSRPPQTREEARQHAIEALHQARDVARSGAEKLRGLFPEWTVHAAAHADSPAWGILAEARKWQASLIVLGSHGRSILQRFFLGSVCQKVAAEAACSVRIYRPHKSGRDSLRVLAAVDGSGDSERAVEELLSREWPAETAVELVTVVDPKLRSTWSALLPREDWREMADSGGDWVPQMLEGHAKALQQRGLEVKTHILEGDPKTELLGHAERLGADAIFLGARGLQHGSRLYLGTLASAIATRAPCTVEIVRPASEPATASASEGRAAELR